MQIVCTICGLPKPECEFYESEIGNGNRCKPCFRRKQDRQDKRSGRQSMSLTAAEVRWLRRALLDMLRSPDARQIAANAEYRGISGKIFRMADRSKANIES